MKNVKIQAKKKIPRSIMALLDKEYNEKPDRSWLSMLQYLDHIFIRENFRELITISQFHRTPIREEIYLK